MSIFHEAIVLAPEFKELEKERETRRYGNNKGNGEGVLSYEES